MTVLRLIGWLGRHISLAVLLTAAALMGAGIGSVVRGAALSLFAPVTLVAALCGWGAARTRLNGWQAAGSLAVLGAAGVFAAVAGLARPLGALILSLFDLIPQLIFWLRENIPPDLTSLLTAWSEITDRTAALLTRLWAWRDALAASRPIQDPAAAALTWGLGLWLACAWAGWQMRRNRNGLAALAPGGVGLALALDYSGGAGGLAVGYLAAMLALTGLGHWERLRVRLAHRSMDYADSVPQETLAAVVVIGVLLAGLAGVTPSLSWQTLRDWLQPSQTGNTTENLAEAVGLERAPAAPGSSGWRDEPGGLPRSQLVGMPPAQGESVVMTVSTGDLPPMPGAGASVSAPRYHWRTVTYDIYTGRGWGSSPAQIISLKAKTALLGAPPGYRLLRQQVSLAATESVRVYWAGVLAEADAPLEIAWRIPPPDAATPAQPGDMLGALTIQSAYTVISYLPAPSLQDLRAAGTDYPPEVASRYLALPDSVPERVLALARDLTAAARTPYDRAVQIEAYLRQFPYTLEIEPPPFGRDTVDYFLFDLQKGYCDYYASAMVVLSRAAGLPARLVVGYASGEYDPARAVYVVRQKDAHAWAEVYFPGIGWVEFEPTAAQPRIIRPGAPSGNPNEADLRPVGDALITAARVRWRMLVSTLGGQAALAALSLVLLAGVWQAGEIWALYLLSALVPQRAVNLLYTRLRRRARVLLPGLTAGHTPYELQSELLERLGQTKIRLAADYLRPSNDETARIVALYIAQTFSPHPPNRAQIRAAIRAWSALRWRLRVIGWVGEA